MLKRVGTKTHARVDIVGKHNNKNALAHVHISQNLDNGAICTLGDFMSGELMAREAVDVTGTTKREDIVMLKAPEIVADESSKDLLALKYFYNQAGEIVRGYYLKDLDKIHVSAEAVTPIDGSTPVAVGQYVIPDGTYKLKASASDPGTTKFVGIVETVEETGFPYFGSSAGVKTSNMGYVLDTRIVKVKIRVIKND